MATGLEPVLGYLKYVDLVCSPPAAPDLFLRRIVGRILAKADPELSATVGMCVHFTRSIWEKPEPDVPPRYPARPTSLTSPFLGSSL